MEKKSTFNVACNLLSQRVKEKRSFAEQLVLNGNNRPQPTTLSLFPGVDVSDDDDDDVPIEKSRLTIFYSGKMFVFDDFSDEKAKDLMQLAKSGSSAAASSVIDMLHESLPSTKISNCPDLLAQTRRASLHRFLHKRIERINAKAPYQVNKSKKMGAVAKTEENISWLGLG